MEVPVHVPVGVLQTDGPMMPMTIMGDMYNQGELAHQGFYSVSTYGNVILELVDSTPILQYYKVGRAMAPPTPPPIPTPTEWTQLQYYMSVP